jgi:integrase
MASISRESGGRRTVQFVKPDGKRLSIRLGKVNQRTADTIKAKLEELAQAVYYGASLDDDTASWLTEIDHGLVEKLEAAGLVPDRYRRAKRERVTLGAFIDGYMTGRTDIKQSTRLNLEQVRGNLLEFFGSGKFLEEVTPGDADDFRRFLLGRLGENTVRRHCGRAKQFFRAALRKRLLAENPFADMKDCGVKGSNASRIYFISLEEAGKVLEACPDAQWRLLFALSRFGGLRCPSEHLTLRWADIDWERGRMTVRSPKTEHFEGRECRVVPIFPELRPYLDQVWEEAEAGTEYVITRYRGGNANLRTQLERIITRAGLQSWPKLFQNLRSTRETELVAKFPLHVVTAWLGNTAAVAAKHYLQVTEADFNRAVESGAESGAPTVQKPVQHPAAPICTEAQETTQALGIPGLVPFGA